MTISAYTTPQSIIRQLEKADSGTMPTEASADYTAFFTLVKDYCVEVSDWFNGRTQQTFVPTYEAKTFYLADLIEDRQWHGDIITLPEPLLEIDSLTWLDTAISSTYYHLLRDYQTQRTPYTRIRLDTQSVSLTRTGAFDDAVTVTGWWGYHNSYAQAYTNMETVTLTNGTVTSITVVNSALYDTYDYIRIEDELLWITALASSTSLTVQRGVNGTTAAAHAAQTVQKYTVQPAVQHALTRFVAWAYDNRSSFGTLQFSDGSAVVQAMPVYVQEAVEMFTASLFGVP